MREISTIKQDMASAHERLRQLYGELDLAVAARDKEICRLHDEGQSFHEIGKRVSLHHATVKNILWRNGRTVGGRLTLKALRKAGV